MKIRNGFVSNSSSSSFIIAVKKPTPDVCKKCGSIDIDFLGLLERVQTGETGLHARGYSDTVQHFEEYIRDMGYDPCKAPVEISSCPTCRSNESVVATSVNSKFQAYCEACQSRGPLVATKAEALLHWDALTGASEKVSDYERHLYKTLKELKGNDAHWRKESYELAAVDVSYHDEALTAIMDAAVKTKRIIVIHSDN